MTLDGQLLQYKDNLQNFYKNKKINVITEAMVRQGLDELPSTADLNKERIKYDVEFQNLKKTEHEMKEVERRKQIMPGYLVSTLLHEKAEDINGIEGKRNIKRVNQTLEQLQEKEAQIIHDLYETHFVQKGGSDKLQSPNLKENSQEPAESNLINAYMNQSLKSRADKTTNFETIDITNQRHDQSYADEFKYIQYIPKDTDRQ